MREEKRVYDRLLFFTCLTIVLLVAIGITNYFYVKKIDREYTDLLDQDMRVTRIMSQSSTHAFKSMFLCNKLLLTSDKKEKEDLAKKLEEFITTADSGSAFVQLIA